MDIMFEELELTEKEENIFQVGIKKGKAEEREKIIKLIKKDGIDYKKEMKKNNIKVIPKNINLNQRILNLIQEENLQEEEK